jgi:hypothetical protein
MTKPPPAEEKRRLQSRIAEMRAAPDQELRRNQAERDKARAAQKKRNRKRAAEQKPQYHNCAICGAKIRVEFKHCRGCSGIRSRPDLDAIKRRLPGSFGSNSH